MKSNAYNEQPTIFVVDDQALMRGIENKDV